jgi:hypothetical protein
LALTSAQDQSRYGDMQLSNLSPQQLRTAADLKERIDALEDELNELLGTAETPPVEAPAKPTATRRPKRTRKTRRRVAAGAPPTETRHALRQGDGGFSTKAAVLQVLESGEAMTKKELVEKVSALQGKNTDPNSLGSRLYEMKTKDKTIISPEPGVYRLK